jgi:uncharacterized protein YktA (UPF0223 family)
MLFLEAMSFHYNYQFERQNIAHVHEFMQSMEKLLNSKSNAKTIQKTKLYKQYKKIDSCIESAWLLQNIYL